MKRIGIAANFNKKEAKKVVLNLIAWLRKKGKEVILNEETAKNIKGNFKSYPIDKLATYSDLLISLGGDGTLLRVSRSKDIHKVPVLGVNLGGLGFLTEVTTGEIYKVLERVLRGKYEFEERMMLKIKITKKGKEVHPFTALNELVLAKNVIARLLHLEIFIDKDYVTTYECDGLIVSTPTGSTGHSLSAGGPIVEPTMEALVLSPICPHILSNRPLIIPSSKEIRIKTKPITRTKEISATIDGQQAVNLSFEEVVSIKASGNKLKLIVSPERSYYQLLREKLSWGER